MFCPFKLLERVREPNTSAWAIVQPLLHIKGFTNDLLSAMCEQYVALVPLLTQWCDGKVIEAEVMKRVDGAWVFWVHLNHVAPTCSAWVTAALRVALLLPSSCDVERFFSTATGTTKRTQMALDEDNQEIRHLLAFNPERAF